MEELSKLHYGHRIEAKAESWYLSRTPGSRVVARRFRWRGGEIDLVVEEPSSSSTGRWELVFIEVRARLACSWEGGVESVRAPKRQKLRRGIEIFLGSYSGQAQSARLDVLAWDGDNWEHLKDAWWSDTG